MKKSWINGLDEQEVKDVKSDFISSKVIRKRLSSILRDRIEKLRETGTSRARYDENWALRRADDMGMERAYREIISMLEE